MIGTTMETTNKLLTPPQLNRGRNLGRLAAVGALALVSLVAEGALAQQDINPPLPNVMLLVDTSGSMELMPDGNKPNVCGATNTSSDMNRWAALVSVLTGTVESRGCYSQARNDPAFIAEYSIAGTPPYDQTYQLPHHRIVSNGCVAGPGVLPGNAFDWPAGAIGYHPYNNSAGSCAAPGFVQFSDGLMDVYRDRLRFGLMTFDPRTSAGTGVSGATSVDVSTGFDGLWSYYDGWQSGGSATQGHPPGLCLSVVRGRRPQCRSASVGRSHDGPWPAGCATVGDSNRQ